MKLEKKEPAEDYFTHSSMPELSYFSHSKDASQSQAPQSVLRGNQVLNLLDRLAEAHPSCPCSMRPAVRTNRLALTGAG